MFEMSPTFSNSHYTKYNDAMKIQVYFYEGEVVYSFCKKIRVLVELRESNSCLTYFNCHVDELCHIRGRVKK